jgi:hypothetical protein
LTYDSGANLPGATIFRVCWRQFEDCEMITPKINGAERPGSRHD